MYIFFLSIANLDLIFHDPFIVVVTFWTLYHISDGLK